ncbi:MAG: hypothetical protein J6S19_08620, partial [Lentisphaeria bacterium]|nr:hypothetical protein [Lentisphaeria bacterium]
MLFLNHCRELLSGVSGAVSGNIGSGSAAGIAVVDVGFVGNTVGTHAQHAGNLAFHVLDGNTHDFTDL